MKKLILLGLVLIMTSCFGTKKTVEKTTTTNEKEKIESVSDSVSKVTINKAIDDKITTKIAETGDADLDARIDEILSKINTSKSSGSSSYNLYFNKKTRELIAELKIGQTQDSISSTSNVLIVEKTTQELITEYSETIRNMIPWWLWVIVAFFLLPHILKILSIFNPAIGVARKILQK